MDLTLLLAIVAVVIALVGGIPGYIEIRNKWIRSAFEVQFDKNNSFACFIDSPGGERDGKLAVLLGRVEVIGKGSSPSFLARVEVYVRCGRRWVLGQQFYPAHFPETDKNGVTKEAIRVCLGSNPKADCLLLAGWEKFSPGTLGLAYGQPLTFSAAFVFDIQQNRYAACDQLRLELLDYHGKRYRKLVRAFTFEPRYQDYTLKDFDYSASAQ